MLAGYNKSGLGGAGNTVTPRPDPYEGGAVINSTKPIPPTVTDRPKLPEPVRVGDLLPGVLAEMRRIQREREGR